MNPLKWFYNGWFALLVVSVLLVWQAIGSLQLWHLYHQSTDAPVIHTVPAVPHLVNISNYHVFGTYVAKANKSDEIPLSSLNFSVIGIFLAVPANQSTALLDLGEGSSKIYHVGDSLQGDVKLYKILKDSVVIEREGNYESIPLDKETLQFEPKAEPLSLDAND